MLIISNVFVLVASIITVVVLSAVSVKLSQYGLEIPVPNVIVYAVELLSILNV